MTNAFTIPKTSSLLQGKDKRLFTVNQPRNKTMAPIILPGTPTRLPPGDMPVRNQLQKNLDKPTKTFILKSK